MPNWIDTVFLVCLAVAILKSFRAGTFRLLVEIVVFFLSIYFAEKICRVLIFDSKLMDASNTLAFAIAFFFFFSVINVILRIGVWLLSKVVKVEILGTVDKVGAAGLGILIALLNAGLIINLSLMFPFSQPAKQYIQSSAVNRISAPVYSQMYKWAFAFSPEMDKMLGTQVEQTVKATADQGAAVLGGTIEKGKAKLDATIEQSAASVKNLKPITPPAKIL